MNFLRLHPGLGAGRVRPCTRDPGSNAVTRAQGVQKTSRNSVRLDLPGLTSVPIERAPCRGLSQDLRGPGWAGKRHKIGALSCPTRPDVHTKLPRCALITYIYIYIVSYSGGGPPEQVADIKIDTLKWGVFLSFPPEHPSLVWYSCLSYRGRLTRFPLKLSVAVFHQLRPAQLTHRDGLAGQ